MKKIAILLFMVLLGSFVSVGQTTGTTTCNLSVTIDSVVVPPCFRVTGGACGCTNSLWAVVNGGTAPYTYTWTTSDGYVWGNSDTIHGACYEVWIVKVGDSRGCVDSATINVVIPSTHMDSTASAGINMYSSSSSSLKLYPVPASNQLNVNLGAVANNIHIEVYDVLGNKLMTQTINDGTLFLTLDVSTFANGNYFLKIIGSNGQKTSKFAVDK
jgi:hypothetical protein